jgi:para-nitrobenzyl esterase
MGSGTDIKTYIKNAESRYGEMAAEYLRLFPANTEAELQNSMKLSSVLSFGWQNYTWARMQTETGKNKAYLYYFSHVPPGEPNYGAFHSAEFGYALNTLKLWDRPFTEIDYNLAGLMSSYWVNFARSGNPNGEGLPEWLAFDPFSPQIIEFGDEVKPVPIPFREQLEFFDRFNR